MYSNSGKCFLKSLGVIGFRFSARRTIHLNSSSCISKSSSEIPCWNAFLGLPSSTSAAIRKASTLMAQSPVEIRSRPWEYSEQKQSVQDTIACGERHQSLARPRSACPASQLLASSMKFLSQRTRPCLRRTLLPLRTAAFASRFEIPRAALSCRHFDRRTFSMSDFINYPLSLGLSYPGSASPTPKGVVGR